MLRFAVLQLLITSSWAIQGKPFFYDKPHLNCLLNERLDAGPSSKISTLRAKECHSSWVRYRKASSEWAIAHAPTTTEMITLDRTFIINEGRGDIYTDATG